jgi:hypothetical protein
MFGYKIFLGLNGILLGVPPYLTSGQQELDPLVEANLHFTKRILPNMRLLY